MKTEQLVNWAKRLKAGRKTYDYTKLETGSVNISYFASLFYMTICLPWQFSSTVGYTAIKKQNKPIQALLMYQTQDSDNAQHNHHKVYVY